MFCQRREKQLARPEYKEKIREKRENTETELLLKSFVGAASRILPRAARREAGGPRN